MAYRVDDEGKIHRDSTPSSVPSSTSPVHTDYTSRRPTYNSPSYTWVWVVGIIVLFVAIRSFIVPQYNSNVDGDGALSTEIISDSPVASSPTTSVPTPKSTTATIENHDTSEYILSFSSTRELTESDLIGLSKEELRIARNEIFARHGRQFKDSGLQAHFDSKEWYQLINKLPLGTEPQLSSMEISNAEFIKKYE